MWDQELMPYRQLENTQPESKENVKQWAVWVPPPLPLSFISVAVAVAIAVVVALTTCKVVEFKR